MSGSTDPFAGWQVASVAAPPPVAPQLPAWAIGGAPSPATPVPTGKADPFAGWAAAPVTKAPETPDRSSLGGMLKAIPSGLYAGVSGVANAPTYLANAASDLLSGLTGQNYGHLKPPIETNPTGYQPKGTAERSIYAGAQAAGSLPALAVGGEAATPLLKLGGVPRIVAEGMTVPGRAAIPVAAGAGVGQAASEAVPEPYAPAVNMAVNLAVGGGLGAADALAGKAYTAGTTKLGEMGIGPKIEIPGAVNAEGKPLRVTQSQADAASRKLMKAAGPDAGQFQQQIAEPDSMVPGVQRTTAQQAPVPGIVDLDTAYRTAYPAEFNARAQAQGTALGQAVQGVAPEGANPQSVGAYLTQQLDDLAAGQKTATDTAATDVRNQVTEAGGNGTPEGYGTAISGAVERQQAPLQAAAAGAVDEAQAARDQAVGAFPATREPIPGGATVPEQYGTEARVQALIARSAEADRLAALKAAINPEGDSGTYSQPFREGVQQIYADRSPSAQPLSGDEKQILSVMQSWPAVVPLNDVIDLRQWVNGAIAKETGLTGAETPVSARLAQVKGAIDQSLEDVVNNHHAFEQQAVSAGQMSPEATMMARLEAWKDGQRARQAQEAVSAGGNSGGSDLEGTGTRAAPSAGAFRAASEAGGGPGNPPGTQSVPRQVLSNPTRPLSPEELAAYQAWRQQYAAFKGTYDQGVPGDILQRGEFPSGAEVPAENVRAARRLNGGFKVQDSEVMDRLWNAKSTEAANLRAAQQAGITPETLTGYAADDLRRAALGQDGTFDLKAYAKWRRAHAAGLHLFPEVAAAFDGAAKAQETLAAAQANAADVAAAHPLKGIQFLSEIPGKYLQAGDTGAEQVRQFARDTGNDPSALHAFDDYVVYRMRGEGVVRQDGTVDPKALARFQNKYQSALSVRSQLSAQLSSLKTAQQTLDDVTAEYQARIDAFQNGVARNFLHDDPQTAVRKAFSTGNPPETFRGLVDAVKDNPDGAAGLRKAVADFIVDRMSSARPAGEEIDFLKAGQFRAWVRHNKDALRVIFGGQGMQNLEQVVAELRRQAFRAEAASGSPTTQYLIGAKRAGLTESHGHGASTLLTGLIGEHIGGPVMAGGAVAAKWLVSPLRQAGIKTTNDLVKSALLNIPVARALAARATVSSAPRRLAAALQGVTNAALARPPAQSDQQ